MRGLILHLTRETVVRRALSQLVAIPEPPPGAPKNAGGRYIQYRLREKNGGFDPTAPHCASWSYGNRTPTADCIGFVLWASGIDRKQPGYKGKLGEWLNCESLVADADGAWTFCRPLGKGEKPLPGDWCLTEDHIGLYLRLTPEPVIIDCSPRHGDTIGIGKPWSRACRAIRPLFYAEAT